jgi:hypothetical protein
LGEGEELPILEYVDVVICGFRVAFGFRSSSGERIDYTGFKRNEVEVVTFGLDWVF